MSIKLRIINVSYSFRQSKTEIVLYVICVMLKRSIAISCIFIIFASYFDSSVGKKLFAKNATTSCVQAARISLLVNMAINSTGTLNTKLILVDLKASMLNERPRGRITKMTEILFQAITIHRLYIEKSEKTTNYSIE